MIPKKIRVSGEDFERDGFWSLEDGTQFDIFELKGFSDAWVEIFVSRGSFKVYLQPRNERGEQMLDGKKRIFESKCDTNLLYYNEGLLHQALRAFLRYYDKYNHKQTRL